MAIKRTLSSRWRTLWRRQREDADGAGAAPRTSHIYVADLRGYSRLVVDAAVGLTRIVETMHHNILRTPGILGEPTRKPANGITGFVYKSIRGTTRFVGSGIDAVLGRFAALYDGRAASSRPREALLAALNGVLGDHLASSRNPLAIPMQWRRAGHPLAMTRNALAAAFPHASRKLLLLVHGLCMNDLQWRRQGHDHGAALASAGYTPVYLHYNSGLHISSNGRAFAGRIEALVRAWPVPVEEIVILGNSMGGLVARSACHYAEAAGHRWRRRLRKLIFLGTPHHGAPLERGGHWIDVILDASPYTTAFARLGKIRSAGITDLHYGSMLDDDWKNRDRFARARRKPAVLPLPDGVECYAIAAVISKKSSRVAERLLGDGLVPLDSALGRHKDAQRDLALPPERQWIGYGLGHLDLLDDKAVCAQIRAWLQAGRARKDSAGSGSTLA